MIKTAASLRLCVKNYMPMDLNLRKIPRPIYLRYILLNIPGLVWCAIIYLYPDRGPVTTLVLFFSYGFSYWIICIRYVIDIYDMDKISDVVPAVRRLEFLRR